MAHGGAGDGRGRILGGRVLLSGLHVHGGESLGLGTGHALGVLELDAGLRLIV